MKHVSSLFVIAVLTTMAFAAKGKVETVEENAWRYSCTVTDANYGHYWGASNNSQAEAYNRAMNNCYSRSDAMGTCQLVSCK